MNDQLFYKEFKLLRPQLLAYWPVTGCGAAIWEELPLPSPVTRPSQPTPDVAPLSCRMCGERGVGGEEGCQRGERALTAGGPASKGWGEGITCVVKKCPFFDNLALLM